MSVSHQLPTSAVPLAAAKVKFHFGKLRSLSPTYIFCSPFFKPQFISKASVTCRCSHNGSTNDPYEGFSVLPSDIPWESKSIWSNLALYLFSLHIPLSYGGFSVVAQIMNQHDLDPQTEAVSLLVIQTLELLATLLLLRLTAKQEFEFINLFKVKKMSVERNWLLASTLGFGFLLLLILCTSIIADCLIGPKTVNDPILKDILLSGEISKTACTLVYSIVIPIAEETVYRGFLLTSLSSMMKWHKAVIISSAVFSVAHFSSENFLQLFIIGCVLGCSYCWTGTLTTSIIIHSLYNAFTLLVTLSS